VTVTMRVKMKMKNEDKDNDVEDTKSKSSKSKKPMPQTADKPRAAKKFKFDMFAASLNTTNGFDNLISPSQIWIQRNLVRPNLTKSKSSKSKV